MAEYRTSVVVSGVITLAVWLLVSQSVDTISEAHPFNKTGQNNQEMTNSSAQTSNTLVETNHEPATSEIKQNKEESPKNAETKVEQPEIKPSVKTGTQEKINSSTQPTKTLTDSKIEEKLQKEGTSNHANPL